MASSVSNESDITLSIFKPAASTAKTTKRKAVTKKTNNKKKKDKEEDSSSNSEYLPSSSSSSSSDDDGDGDNNDKKSSSSSSEIVDVDVDLELNRHQFLADESLVNAILSRLPANTQKMLRWASGIFYNWRRSRNNAVETGELQGTPLLPTLPLAELNNEQLALQMSKFVMEVRNSDGGYYKTRTLCQVVSYIQSFLCEQGRQVNFLKDPSMYQVKASLDCAVRTAGRDDITTSMKRVTRAIPETVVDQCWMSGQLGAHAAEPLFHALVFTLGMHCTLRGASEHRGLRFAYFKRCFKNGRQCLVVTLPHGKTTTPNLRRPSVKPKVVEIFALPGDDSERCPVHLYDVYMAHVPLQAVKCDTAFYLQPLVKKNGDVWFSVGAVGVNKIAKVVKQVTKTLGHDGFTNHSLRATGATRLHEAGESEHSIMSLTGHSSSSVRRYIHSSTTTRARQSDIISGAYVPPTASESGSSINHHQQQSAAATALPNIQIPVPAANMTPDGMVTITLPVGMINSGLSISLSRNNEQQPQNVTANNASSNNGDNKIFDNALPMID